MEKQKYRETIAKLLALSESPNENEAKAALLKAQELMARHKISEAEARGVKPSQEKVVRFPTDISFTERTDPWIPTLAAVIAENYGCLPYLLMHAGRKTRQVCFLGLESDLEVCTSAFEYAVQFIQKSYDYFRSYYKGCGAKVIRTHYNSYAFGFIRGMEAAYEEQKKAMQFEVALTTPQEVLSEMDAMNLSRTSFRNAYRPVRESGAFETGFREGRKFATPKKLETGEET